MESNGRKPEPNQGSNAKPESTVPAGQAASDAEQTTMPRNAATAAESRPPVSNEVAEKRVEPLTVEPGISRRKLAQVSRRELLKVAPVLALGAFVIPGAQEWLLKKGLGFSDWASARMFRSGHLAQTFSDSELTPFNNFPINDYDVDDPGVIFENWTLTVTGLAQKPGDYTLARIQQLPLQRQNTRHICVEGWDVIGRFGGTRLSNFLKMIGADTTANYVTVACADDYYESLDMATALHPQTLLCWEMYDQPLTREHGAPLRLQIPTKIGYKQAKYLTDLKVTNVLDGKVGYWEDQGYSYFYGL
ncbi:MAG TPA: molybdopterin-dependent oxidoreductase [Verrucomicrobiae bacterium]|jgi:DMSO/TMAO reductase YedYZ molybdopterin-dependent catalytic subunit|nr:molybdopterin-dependent oxidoreductase [Verrucomicrobiae bacterium]